MNKLQTSVPRYSDRVDDGMSALLDNAAALIRDVQTQAAKDRSQSKEWGFSHEPAKSDAIGEAIFHRGRTADELEELARCFAELHRFTLSHAYYLQGQADVLPSPYKEMVEERGVYMSDGVTPTDEYEITVTKLPPRTPIKAAS
jgi:hypothetical protein